MKKEALHKEKITLYGKLFWGNFPSNEASAYPYPLSPLPPASTRDLVLGYVKGWGNNHEKSNSMSSRKGAVQ